MLRRTKSHVVMTLVGILASCMTAPSRAQEAASASLGAVVDRGVAYLRAAQADDGSFSKQTGPAVTALVAAALLENGRSSQDPVVAPAINFVLQHAQPDGGIYQPGSRHRNYETTLAVMCLAAANDNGQHDAVLQAAEAFLKGLQWDADEGHDESSESYGGAGYGSHSRPDLSNTSFLIEALQSLGNDSDDPAIQKALVFVSRCQNLETQYNQSKFPALNPDGGFYYTIAAGGSSQAGDLPNGGLRSYGSMTYAGLKSMIYAGVNRDDPRVKAAVEWLGKHYSLDENPGMGDAGVYYYYHTFAKALKAFGNDEFVGEDGAKHDWRQDLIAELASRQQENGSWINENNRWLEGDPNLVTGYVLLALAQCRDD